MPTRLRADHWGGPDSSLAEDDPAWQPECVMPSVLQPYVGRKPRRRSGRCAGPAPSSTHQGRSDDYGGDRQANAALHRIVFTRLRHDPRTHAYYERRTQEGKTRREIIRCLKRYAAREVFNLVRAVSSAPVIGASVIRERV